MITVSKGIHTHAKSLSCEGSQLVGVVCVYIKVKTNEGSMTSLYVLAGCLGRACVF